jgi:predicted ATPase
MADPRVDCLSYAAWILWLLGYPDQALARSQEAVALAEGLSHPFSLALALGSAALCHLFRREEQVARERAEAVVRLSTEQGFPFWLAWGTIVRGWALAEQGQVEEGIAQMQQGLAAFQAMGVELFRPHYLALLAEAYGKGRRPEEGLAVLAEALAVVDTTGMRYTVAELYRVQGEQMLQTWHVAGATLHVPPPTQHRTSSTHAEAEACFHKAIEMARQQRAKSWELRAVMSLSRLWQSQGKQEAVRQMLAESYGWFTEGFDTKDVQEAKALLAELA